MRIDNRRGYFYCYMTSGELLKAKPYTNKASPQDILTVSRCRQPNKIGTLKQARLLQTSFSLTLSYVSLLRRSLTHTWCPGVEWLIRYHLFSLFSHFYFPACGQAVVTGVVPSPPRFLPSIFITHRVQHSHCSSSFHRVLQTHALALSASQLFHKKKSQQKHLYEYALGGARTHETDLYIPGSRIT